MSIYGKNIDLYRDYLMINEAYVGKTPTLLKIEEKIGEARKKIKYYGANNTLKEVLEINRLFEKQFGMDIFALQIVPSNIPNAFTRVIGTNFDIADEVDLSKMVVGNITDGYKYRYGNNFCVMVYVSYGLLSMEFSDSEILAIILHEIGHNFADCIYNTINISNKEMMKAYKNILIRNAILGALLTLLYGIGIFKLIDSLKQLHGKDFNNRLKNKDQKRNQVEGKGKFSSLLNSLKGKYNDISSFISGVVERIFMSGYIRLALNQQSNMGVPETMKKNIGRQNEVLADKFAGIYGYGPELTSSLLKLDSFKSDSYKFVGKILPSLNDEYEDAIRRINDYDVHPHTIQRANEDLKLLNNELKKKDLDPKVKKVIESQIKEIEDIIEKYLKSYDELDKNDKAKRLYAAYVKDECPDAIDKEIEDKIEKALEDALDKK